MPVTFDDLIPATGENKSLSFDDLIPEKKSSDAPLSFTGELGAGHYLNALAVGLDKARNIGTEAVSSFSPELSARIFGQTTESLRPNEIAPPIIPPEAAKQIVGQLPSWAGGNTPFGQGVTESAASALSSLSSPGALAQLPAFALPGVSETYALNILHDLPDQGRRLLETANQYGWGSKETGQLAAEYGITDLTGLLAGAHSTLARGIKGEINAKPAEVPKVEPERFAPLPETQDLRSPTPTVQSFRDVPAEPSRTLKLSENDVELPQPEITTHGKPEQAPSVQAGTEEQGQAQGKQEEVLREKEAVSASVEAQGQTEPTSTSTKNEVTDQERIARDIAPAVETAKREFGTVWDEAEKTAATDPTAPERLVSEVAANPRALTDHENALLLRRQIEVQNEHDAAIRAVNEAPNDAARADASVRLERARDDLQTVYDAAKSAGTETGRGLNARKMLAHNDYSLAKMEATTRAVVNNGKSLTERQAADVKSLHERIRAAEEKLSAYEAREQFEIELKKAKAEARQTGFKPQSFLEQQAARARERIIARRGKLFADPIGITQVAHLADEAIIGASHIARGVTKFTDWSAQMIADFGDRIKPYLQGLYAKARELHAKAGNRTLLTAEERQQRGLEGDKKRIQTNIEKIQAKTEAGDFSKPEKKSPRMDAEKARLMFEYQKAKEAYNKGLLEAQLAKQSVPRKALRYGGEMLNTTRALMTSFDLSAVLRQGGFIGFGHPIRALRAFPDMIRALRSEQSQFRVMEDIRNRPNAPLYQQAKLYISDQGPGVSLSKMEEQYMSRWARHIPGVGASERAYTTFLNRLRADSFDAMAANLGKRGKVTLNEAKAIANYVNVATGRGNLDAAAKAATGLNTIFFAPRYVVSRFQMLAGQPLMRGNFRTRSIIAKEYARTLAGAATVYALGQSAGASISTDPTSPDFLKLKFGNTRVDPLFGLTQASVFLTREGIALKRFATQDQSKEPKYGSGGEVLGRFLRTKLAPAIGSGVDILSGKNVVGQKVTPGTVAKQLLVPLSFGDIYSAMKEQGMPQGAILAILALFGMGVQNYTPKQAPQSTPRSLRQAMEERRLETMARDLQAA